MPPGLHANDRPASVSTGAGQFRDARDEVEIDRSEDDDHERLELVHDALDEQDVAVGSQLPGLHDDERGARGVVERMALEAADLAIAERMIGEDHREVRDRVGHRIGIVDDFHREGGRRRSGVDRQYAQHGVQQRRRTGTGYDEERLA